MMVETLDALLADLTSGDDDRAEAVVPRLAVHPEAVPAVGNLLRSPESDVRWWGIRTLAQMDHPPQEWLVKALDDASDEVRQCAALALAHHPTEAAIPGLLRLVMETDAVASNLAATALIAIGVPAIPGLTDLFEQAPHSARVEIIRALANIGDMGAVPLLMRALEQDSPAMAYWAEQGLDRLGLGMVYTKPE